MQCRTFAADPSRLTPCRLRGIFKQRFRTSVGSSASSNCSHPGAHTPHLWLRSLCPASASTPSMVPQERLSAAADPVKVMSSCRPILVISQGAGSSDSERANSSPSITCMARDPCHPPLVVLSTVQPSSHRFQNFVSQGSHWAAQFAASCGHAVLAASKHIEREALP